MVVVVSGKVVVSITHSKVVEGISSRVVVGSSVLVVTSETVVVTLKSSVVEVMFPSGDGVSSMHKPMNNSTETKKTNDTLAITKYQV
jgi:hypothetical protein